MLGKYATSFSAAKKNLSELRQLYFKLKDQVFSSGRLRVGYDTDALEEVLKETFGTDATMADCRYPKCVYIAI